MDMKNSNTPINQRFLENAKSKEAISSDDKYLVVKLSKSSVLYTLHCSKLIFKN